MGVMRWFKKPEPQRVESSTDDSDVEASVYGPLTEVEKVRLRRIEWAINQPDSEISRRFVYFDTDWDYEYKISCEGWESYLTVTPKDIPVYGLTATEYENREPQREQEKVDRFNQLYPTDPTKRAVAVIETVFSPRLGWEQVEGFAGVYGAQIDVNTCVYIRNVSAGDVFYISIVTATSGETLAEFEVSGEVYQAVADQFENGEEE